MSHNHNTEIPGLHPFFSFILSVALYGCSQVVAMLGNIYTWSIPPIFMQLGQYFAWCCMGLTATITVLNYLGIKWNPFKKKK